MPAKKLPARPNLDQYRKRAKDLLKSYEAGHPDALSRIRQHHPRFNKATCAIDGAVLRLSDAQWVIAREHGFESWAKFAGHIRRIPARDSGTRATQQSRFELFSISLDIRTDELYTCVFTRDGTRAVTGAQGNPVRVWDVETGRCVVALDEHSVGSWGMTWSQDGRHIVFGPRDGAVQVWDLESGGLCSHVLEGHSGFIRCVDVSSDGCRVLSGSGSIRDPTVRLWDVESDRCLRIMEGHSDGIYDVALDPSQRRALSGSRDTTVRLWDVESGKSLRVFKGHSYHVHSVLWGADQRRVLSSSRDIRLWDVESGRCIRVFDQDDTDSLIRKLAWSADQRTALSASHDGTVRLWDVESGRCLRVLDGHPVGVVTVAWDVDERRAYSCDWNGGIRGWDLA
jgi:WD40 repeat protein